MTILAETQGSVRVLTLNRPDKRNAISQELGDSLRGELERAGADEAVHAVVLAATGAVWAAGGDLDELTALGFDAAGAEAVLGLAAVPRAVEACAVPVVAAVQGPVLGGGAELLMACDLAVFGPAASVAFVHAKMGVVPAWGGATRLVECVGATRAAEILYTARTVEAEEAVAIGLAARLAADPRAAAVELGAELEALGRESLRRMKRSLREVREARRGDALERERAVFRDAWGSEAHRAAFGRYARRRPGRR